MSRSILIMCAVLTILIVNDQFSFMEALFGLSPQVVNWIMLILLFGGIILYIISLFKESKIGEEKKANPKKAHRDNLFLLSYILLLLFVFPLVGGESTAGFSLSNPLILVILLGGIAYHFIKMRNASKEVKAVEGVSKQKQKNNRKK
ncbi:hypothetical protein [Bacillus horti]|uniref:Ca2+/Na+ antiporter n=1 Tax=Caldalkalibacillus horti TaxID=77523 RepID=A0ABT9W415_9BACI|nr:hypothetical protein [Bacillus horti]MDQ0167870.1 Ca2+/Na+ antiporter [Bacillus horti]